MSWTEIMIAIKRGIVASAESVANIVSGATKVGNADKLDGYDAGEFIRRHSFFFNSGETILSWANNPNGIYRKFIVNPIYPSDAPIETEGFVELSIDESGQRKMVIFRAYGTLEEYKREIWQSVWRTDHWFNGFNADTVDGHHAGEFLMVDSYKYIIDSLRADTDARLVQTQPNDYNSVLKLAGLKNNEAIGLIGTGTEYSFVMGIRGWVDFSGGDAHELAFCSNGKLYHRYGATDAWYNWSVLMDSNMTAPVIVSTTAPADTTAVWIVPN